MPRPNNVVKNDKGEFVRFTCSCWCNNPTEGDKVHNGKCTKNHYCIRTRENDPFPTKDGRLHKTYCGAKRDEVRDE